MYKVNVNFLDCTNTKSFSLMTEALRYYADLIDNSNEFEGECMSITFVQDDVVRMVMRPL